MKEKIFWIIFTLSIFMMISSITAQQRRHAAGLLDRILHIGRKRRGVGRGGFDTRKSRHGKHLHLLRQPVSGRREQRDSDFYVL